MPKPFVKNDPRINRAGRPKKGTALTDILNYQLDLVFKAGKLKREAIAEKLIETALAGDVAALKYVFDRLDGKPVQAVVAEVHDNMSDEEKKHMLSIFKEETKVPVRPEIVAPKKKAKPRKDEL
jgi:hypothetical protein